MESADGDKATDNAVETKLVGLPGRLALSVACALTIGASQAHAQHGTQIGVRGGISVASASFDIDTLEEENRTGFVGGPFINFDIGSLGFQIAALYNAKGVNTNVGELDVKYLELPAVVKLGIPLALLKPSIFAGAALALRTSCEIDGIECGEDEFKRSDFLAVVGADVAIYLGGVSLWADARYDVGLTDMNDADVVFGDLKNRNWSLTAGIGFEP